MAKNTPEAELQKAVIRYINLQYGGTLIDANTLGELKLNSFQAARAKALGNLRGRPDLFIILPKGRYHGFFIELKAEYQKGKNTEHKRVQTEIIKTLNNLGYYAVMCYGFDDAKKAIDYYFNL